MTMRCACLLTNTAMCVDCRKAGFAPAFRYNQDKPTTRKGAKPTLWRIPTCIQRTQACWHRLRSCSCDSGQRIRPRPHRCVHCIWSPAWQCTCNWCEGFCILHWGGRCVLVHRNRYPRKSCSIRRVAGSSYLLYSSIWDNPWSCRAFCNSICRPVRAQGLKGQLIKQLKSHLMADCLSGHLSGLCRLPQYANEDASAAVNWLAKH